MMCMIYVRQLLSLLGHEHHLMERERFGRLGHPLPGHITTMDCHIDRVAVTQSQPQPQAVNALGARLE